MIPAFSAAISGRVFPRNWAWSPADVGDDAHPGTDQVGRVESASHPDLDDGNVDPFTGEMVEGHGRGRLEKRRPDAIDGFPMLFHKTDDLLFRDHFTVDADPFTEILQVGGGKQSGAVPGGLQNGGNHVGNRPFSVGAGHMNAGKTTVRIAQFGFQASNIIQPRFIGGAADVLKNG